MTVNIRSSDPMQWKWIAKWNYFVKKGEESFQNFYFQDDADGASKRLLFPSAFIQNNSWKV